MNEVEKQQIHDLRLKGIGYKAIAAILGISRDSIRGYCKRNGLAGDSQAVSLNVKEQINQHLICACCSKPLVKNLRGRSKRFCSEECRRRWWNENRDKRNKKESAIYKYICPNCNKEFSCYGNRNRKYCSHNCYIKSRFWKEDEDGV